MDKQKTLILIDGHALAFRQYYALERTNMQTSDGTPTWAVYGFFKAIFDLLKNKNLQPDAICVTFDVSHHTFRVDQYAEYKSNRESMPDNMQTQMSLIYEGLEAFNIPVYTKEGFEADDVIGTISKKACELGHKVLILTGDQDSFQLIDKDGCVKVIIPSKGILTTYDWEKVHEKLGVYPDQVVDYKSLRGDTSDNIPGVKGIGEKTAVKLLEEFGHLDNVLANCDRIKPDGVRQKICDNVEMAKLSYSLATIVRDVDIDFDFEGTKVVLPELSKVTAFLKKLQLYSFLKNINEILKSFDKYKTGDNTEQSENVSVPVAENGQLGLFAQALKEEANKSSERPEAVVITTLDELKKIIGILKTKSVISFVVGNDGSCAFSYNDNFNGLSYSDNGQSSHSFAFNRFSPDVCECVKEIFENSDLKKITHDTKSVYKYLKDAGITLRGVVFDTLLASYVKDSSRNHNIDIQMLEHKNRVLDTAVTQNFSLSCLAEMSDAVFQLTQFWINDLTENELKLVKEVELPLSIVLAKMECCGVSVDSDYLKSLSLDMSVSLAEIENKIFSISGEAFNINSPKQVADIIYDKLQLKTKKKKKSTSAEVLEELAEEYEIAKLILEYRKFSKLKSTYTDALPELVSKKDNRIHTTYNQTTTVTGRLSSSNPNLQNIPIRTEEGSKIRKAFVPSDRNSSVILSADYSQIELRLLAHISGDKNLIQAFNSGIDVHTLTASKVFGVPVDEVTKQMRYKSKAVNFGIVYGQSKYGLAKALDIKPAEAEEFIEKYFETYPDIRKYMAEIVLFAQENGYVETIFGRRRYLSKELNNPNGMIREFGKRAAINHPMQGSAADLIKLAMVDLDKKLSDSNLKSKLIMQVHDELILEVDKSELDEVQDMVVKAMELSQPLQVPLVVDVSVGESW